MFACATAQQIPKLRNYLYYVYVCLCHSTANKTTAQTVLSILCICLSVPQHNRFPNSEIIYIMYMFVCATAQQTIHNIHYAPFAAHYSPPAFPDFLTHALQQHFFIFIHTNHPCKAHHNPRNQTTASPIPQRKPNTKNQTNKYHPPLRPTFPQNTPQLYIIRKKHQHKDGAFLPRPTLNQFVNNQRLTFCNLFDFL